MCDLHPANEFSPAHTADSIAKEKIVEDDGGVIVEMLPYLEFRQPMIASFTVHVACDVDHDGLASCVRLVLLDVLSLALRSLSYCLLLYFNYTSSFKEPA